MFTFTITPEPDPPTAWSPTMALVHQALGTAVPQVFTAWQSLTALELEAQRDRWTNAENPEVAVIFSEVLAVHCGQPREHEVAFAALAHTLAALAFCPGGVGLLGWRIIAAY